MPEFSSNRQLLCTFTNLKDYRKIVDDILNFYDVYNRKIFVFVNAKNPKEIYLTYNALNVDKNSKKFPDTILIHRKKQFNVLYTLNSMNRLIEEENGKKDPSFVLNWALYQNSLIITGDISVRIIPLKILNII